jgi:hypothetical protein
MAELEAQPPPRKGAKAGYYPDPLGSGRARYWDGASWTPTVGPRVAADAAPSRPVPPPAKVCKHCGTKAETFAGECPNCGKSYTQNTGLIIAAIATAVVATLLFLGGCALFIASVADEVEDELDSTAITQEQFDSVTIGSSRESVEAALGGPFERNENRNGVCLFYNEKSESILGIGSYRFCFDADGLSTKRAISGD